MHRVWVAAAIIWSLGGVASASCDEALSALERTSPALRRGRVAVLACWSHGARASVVLLRGADDPVAQVVGRRARRLAVASQRYGGDIELVAERSGAEVWLGDVLAHLPVTLAWSRPSLQTLELRVAEETLGEAEAWRVTLAGVSGWTVALTSEQAGQARDAAARERLAAYPSWTVEHIEALVTYGLHDFDEIAGMPPQVLSRALQIELSEAAHLVDAVAIWLETASGRP